MEKCAQKVFDRADSYANLSATSPLGSVLATQILFLTSSILSANFNGNPYLLGSKKLRSVVPMKQTRISPSLAVLIFTGAALGQGMKSAAAASGTQAQELQ